MSKPSASEVTRLLQEWRRGVPDAEAQLFDLVLPDLKRLAGHFMRHERRGHTLTPTALVDEIYFKLLGVRETDWQDRRHFFRLAARAMRFFLIDYARAHGDATRVPFDSGVLLPSRSPSLDTALLVGTALDALRPQRPELADVVDVKFFLGMTNEEAADALDCGVRTVERRWHDARAWLFTHLGGSR